jgi:FkbM family methyltransferase
MNPTLRRAVRRLAQPVLEIALPWAERVTGFHTARGDYLPTRLRMLTGRYEAEELGLMRQFLKPGQTVIDAGANVGYTTRFLARAVGGGGRVLALEPNPLIFPLLQQNLAAFLNVEAHNLGLSSRDGESLLFLAGHNYSVASFSEEYPATHLKYMENEAMTTVPVRIERGDEFLRGVGIGRLDVLKIDVEGWELDAFCGLEQTLSGSPGLAIFCEFNPSAQKCSRHEPRELLAWFFDRGFALHYPDDGQLRPLSLAAVDAFIEETAAKSHSTLFATQAKG